MKKNEKEFSSELKCRNCLNTAPMEIVSQYSRVRRNFDESSGFEWDEGDVFRLLLCPACEKIMLENVYYHSERSELREPVIVWPVDEQEILGLPDAVRKAYEAAQRVKSIDINAFAVLIRRLLEIICLDRGASGRTLNDQLADLARKGELPDQLVKMAGGLRQMGNIGAHASIGELTNSEVPFLDSLCRAILEYVYHGPRLIEKVEERLHQIK